MTFLNRTTSLLFILLLCCWGCGDPPPSVMELVLPDNNDTAEPPGENAVPATEAVTEAMPPSADTMGLSEMEAILATDGEVHSPIPDDVYEQLWGHWTKIGSTAPRRYYTKYIDADGIAIVGGDLVDDVFFQVTRHIVLVMTSKLPGLREALSADQPGGVTGDEIPFRFVLTEHFSKDVVNLPERLNVGGTTHTWLGECGPVICRADVAFTPKEWGEPQSMLGIRTITHEMTHAIEYAIFARNLLPNFTERLNTMFEREMDKVHLRTEVDGEPYVPYTTADGTIMRARDLPEWKDRPRYCMANSNSHDNASEMWAWFVSWQWFEHMYEPFVRSLNPTTDPADWYRLNCPNMLSVTEEVFPIFPLEWAIVTRDYTK